MGQALIPDEQAAVGNYLTVHHVPDKKLRFYQYWIDLFLRYRHVPAASGNAPQELQQFLDELGRIKAPWQVKQAGGNRAPVSLLPCQPALRAGSRPHCRRIGPRTVDGGCAALGCRRRGNAAYHPHQAVVAADGEPASPTCGSSGTGTMSGRRRE